MSNPSSSVSADLPTTLRWMREGTAFALGLVDRLAEGELARPSVLPGWTRAHVVAHLARNAEAMCRLASWARTGVENPMYPSYQQRNADIESSAAQPEAVLRAELTETAAALSRELDELGPPGGPGWRSTVRTAQGNEVPATVMPWMRARELWVHGVDLGAGAGLAALAEDLRAAMLGDVAGDMSAKPGCPSATLAPADSPARCPLGDGEPGALTVAGSTAALLGWLIGRDTEGPVTAHSPGGPVPVPELPRWL